MTQIENCLVSVHWIVEKRLNPILSTIIPIEIKYKDNEVSKPNEIMLTIIHFVLYDNS